MSSYQFIIKMALVLLPGFIARRTYYTLIGKRMQQDWESFFEVLLYGLLSSAISDWVLLLIAKVSNFELSSRLALTGLLHDPLFPIDWAQLVLASLFGFFLGFISAYANTYKIIPKLGNLVKATNRFGDNEVWDLLFYKQEVQWIVVRDHRVDLAYYGSVQFYSDLGKDRELLLGDVDVYDNKSGDKLYSTQLMYISRDKYELSIEVPKIFAGNKEEANGIERSAKTTNKD